MNPGCIRRREDVFPRQTGEENEAPSLKGRKHELIKKPGSLIYQMRNLGVCLIRKCGFLGWRQPPCWQLVCFCQTDATKTLADRGGVSNATFKGFLAVALILY